MWKKTSVDRTINDESECQRQGREIDAESMQGHRLPHGSSEDGGRVNRQSVPSEQSQANFSKHLCEKMDGGRGGLSVLLSLLCLDGCHLCCMQPFSTPRLIVQAQVALHRSVRRGRSDAKGRTWSRQQAASSTPQTKSKAEERGWHGMACSSPVASKRQRTY